MISPLNSLLAAAVFVGLASGSFANDGILVAEQQDRLSVIVLSEARCPNCVNLLESQPMQDLLELPGILDAIEFEYVPVSWACAWYNSIRDYFGCAWDGWE
jgi:hypothetical protein